MAILSPQMTLKKLPFSYLQVGINDQKYLKTYGDRVYDGYPEMLVIVSWELARDLKTIQKSDWHAAVVSYVLTLFNGVDMLYSKLQKTNIQINIAGIIIGEQKESFSFLDECSHDSNKDGKYTKLIDALCTNSNIRRYLSGRKKKIPIDSYDAVIFLTRMVLIEDLSSDQTAGIDFHKISRLRGFSNAVFNLYEVKKKNIEVILTAAVESDKYFRYYPVVAHEMAHLMSVYHDEQPFFTVDGKCCGNIEKLTGSNWCDTCLSWSQISEETFNLFFSSPNCCSFINKPRSLLPPGRHRMLTADEQCQCYGHKSAVSMLAKALATN
ncbi:hypothetical protein PV328_007634 [Microctonus aethiopoides]|uniref:Uncharacterized protein n=1 Tax=Microctonus aethiopoides TaxID=144406 RepID=A0AA39C971_9HYME|nr:hypothetical protein PV328_007634 [Microctonus aethiopoides]